MLPFLQVERIIRIDEKHTSWEHLHIQTTCELIDDSEDCVKHFKDHRKDGDFKGGRNFGDEKVNAEKNGVCDVDENIVGINRLAFVEKTPVKT